MLLSINRKVWKSAAHKAGYEFDKGLLPNSAKITGSYKNNKIICDLGGGFYGSYSTIKTRLRIISENIKAEAFNERVKNNSDLKDKLSSFNSGDMYIKDEVIYILANGIINDGDKLVEFIGIATCIIDLL